MSTTNNGHPYWNANDEDGAQERKRQLMQQAQGHEAQQLAAQADVNFSVSDAQSLSPKRIQNRIVRDIDNLTRTGSYVMNDAFPLYRMGDYQEIYHRMSGLRPAMKGSSLASESPIQALEGLSEDQMNITTLKEKISPEKALDQTLNANTNILNVAQLVSDALRTDMLNSRALMAWRGYNGVDGIIGEDGTSSHDDIATSHTLTGNDFSDETNSTPHSVFSEAEELISTDGDFSGNVGPVTAYVPTSVYWDLVRNDNLESRMSDMAAQTIDNVNELETVLSIDNIVEVRTQVPRTNTNGEPVDSSGTVVDFTEAEQENILEPIDDTGTEQRNVVVGAFGPDSGVMPWLVDRLADHIGSAPTGQWSVNMSEGFLLQGWTGHDPAVSWRKIAQEIGLELIEPDNYVVMQGV